MVYRSLRAGSFFSGIGVADVATVFLGAALLESVGTGSAIGDKCPAVAFANLTTVMGRPLPACWVTGRGIGKFQHTCCGWPWQAWQAAPCTSEVDPSDLFGNGAVSRPRLLSVLFHGKKLVMLADVANVYEKLCQSVHRRVHFACINGMVWRVCGEQARTCGIPSIYIYIMGLGWKMSTFVYMALSIHIQIYIYAFLYTQKFTFPHERPQIYR